MGTTSISWSDVLRDDSSSVESFSSRTPRLPVRPDRLARGLGPLASPAIPSMLSCRYSISFARWAIFEYASPFRSASRSSSPRKSAIRQLPSARAMWSRTRATTPILTSSCELARIVLIATSRAPLCLSRRWKTALSYPRESKISSTRRKSRRIFDSVAWA